MSLDPTRPAAAEPAVALVVANRKPAAVVLIALGLAALGGAIYYTNQAFEGARAKTEATVEPPDVKKPESLSTKSPVAFAAVGYLNALILGGCGIWMLVAAPKPTPAEQETEARKAILVVGGL